MGGDMHQSSRSPPSRSTADGLVAECGRQERRQNWLSWLFPAPTNHPKVKDKLESSDPIHEQDVGQAVSTTSMATAAREETLLLLESCHSLDDVRQMVAHHAINPLHNPAFCEAVFEHLLEQPNWLNEISALMIAPEFHPPGSSLHLKCLAKLETIRLTTDMWNISRKSICQAVGLGLVTIGDIQEIIITAAKMNLRLPKSNSPRTPNGNLLHGLVIAVERSSVLSLDDLGFPFLQLLIDVLAKHASFSNALWLLGPYAGPDNINVFVRLVLERLLQMPETENLGSGMAFDLASSLVNLEDSILLRTITKATFQTLGLCPDEADKLTANKLTPKKIFRLVQTPKILVNWRLTLLTLGQLKGTIVPEKGVFAEVLTSTPENQYPLLLAMTWTYLSLSHDYQTSRSLLLRAGFRKVFYTVSDAVADPVTTDRLGRLVMEVYKLPLPNKKFLLLNIGPFVYNRSKLLAFDPTLKPVIEALVDRNFAVLRRSKTYRSAWRNFPNELVALSESINPHLALFKVLSRKWLHNEQRSSGVIIRLLHHNRSLKLALAELGEPSARSRKIHSLYQKTQQPCEADLPNGPEALDFVNHVAASIATTSIYHPRSRLNRIYSLWRFLRKTGAPITEGFTQAVWYVAMKQGGGRGPCPTLSSWVYREIAKAEGETVALRLQLSLEDRVRRMEAFEAAVLNDTDVTDDVTSNEAFDQLNRVDSLYWAQSRHAATWGLPSEDRGNSRPGDDDEEEDDDDDDLVGFIEGADPNAIESMK